MRAFLVAHVSELLLAVALLAGWASLTWGVALYLGWRVWPLSAGVLFCSLAGWRLIAAVALNGLYALTRSSTDGS